MAFIKAVQNINAEIPEYQEYVQVLLLYKQAKKEYAWFRKQYSHWQLSTDPLERVRFFDEKEKHRLVCKRYYETKERYHNAAARARLQERGVDLSALSSFRIAEMLQIDIPSSMMDIIRTEKEQKKQEILAAEMPVEFSENVIEAARKWKERKERQRKQVESGTFGEEI